jgi:hypothetical protein
MLYDLDLGLVLGVNIRDFGAMSIEATEGWVLETFTPAADLHAKDAKKHYLKLQLALGAFFI